MRTDSAEDFDLAIRYIDIIPQEEFEPLLDLQSKFGLEITEHPRPNLPYAALEWFIPTVVALYVGKKFADEFLSRAAEDFADATYPRVKQTVVSLAKRFLVEQREKFSVISSTPLKSTNPHSAIFSVHSVSRFGKQLKFVFDRPLSEKELEAAIYDLFSLLELHFNDLANDVSLEKQVSEVCRPNDQQVFLIYDSLLKTWLPVDPIRMEVERQKKRLQ